MFYRESWRGAGGNPIFPSVYTASGLFIVHTCCCTNFVTLSLDTFEFSRTFPYKETTTRIIFPWKMCIYCFVKSTSKGIYWNFSLFSDLASLYNMCGWTLDRYNTPFRCQGDNCAHFKYFGYLLKYYILSYLRCHPLNIYTMDYLVQRVDLKV